VLVADDEAIARKRLLRLLAAMPDVVVAGECGSAHEVLARVREGDVDVVLLDIQMPELSGIEALPLFPTEGDAPAPAVVFCTAHSAHAVSAFDVGAVDYLLKPVDGGRLRKALDRVRQRVARPREGGPAAPSAVGTVAALAGGTSEFPPLDRLALPTRQGIVLLDPRDVTHAQLADELVTVYAAGRQYLAALSLQDLEARLPPGAFTRVHRRALVNLAHVVRLQPTEVGGYIADVSGGHSVEVSRQAARDLRRRLGLR